jgi:hypothetical protein
MKDEKSKERRDVPEPEPVTLRGVRYEALLWGKARGLDQNGGLIRAIDAKTKSEKWLLKVYDVDYTADMEGDKLDVFISELYFENETLLHVVNERDEHYLVNVDTKAVIKTKD